MKSKRVRALLGAISAAAASVALIAPAAQAAPAPGYEAFAGCPSPSENPEITSCVRSVIGSGYFQMGNKTVPIEKPITLSGGVNIKGENFTFNSQGGLSSAKQLVPGGVIGITGLDWLVNFLNLEGLKLYAITELAGNPSSPVKNPVSLPIKVRLVNPVLGNNCYVGSTSNPINLNLTYFTTSPPLPNEPISGVPPKASNDPATKILSLNGGTFVDNSFSAPAASGCKLTLFGFIPVSINGLVNFQAGLPAAAGTNTTVQNFSAQLVSSKVVYP